MKRSKKGSSVSDGHDCFVSVFHLTFSVMVLFVSFSLEAQFTETMRLMLQGNKPSADELTCSRCNRKRSVPNHN